MAVEAWSWLAYRYAQESPFNDLKFNQILPSWWRAVTAPDPNLFIVNLMIIPAFSAYMLVVTSNYKLRRWNEKPRKITSNEYWIALVISFLSICQNCNTNTIETYSYVWQISILTRDRTVVFEAFTIFLDLRSFRKLNILTKMRSLLLVIIIMSK